MGLDVKGVQINSTGDIVKKDFIAEVRNIMLRMAVTPYNVEENFDAAVICCEENVFEKGNIEEEIRENMNGVVQGTDWWVAVPVGDLQKFIKENGIDTGNKEVADIMAEPPENWVGFIGDQWV